MTRRGRGWRAGLGSQKEPKQSLAGKTVWVGGLENSLVWLAQCAQADDGPGRRVLEGATGSRNSTPS